MHSLEMLAGDVRLFLSCVRYLLEALSFMCPLLARSKGLSCVSRTYSLPATRSGEGLRSGEEVTKKATYRVVPCTTIRKQTAREETAEI